LTELHLEQYFLSFLKEEMYLDVLSLTNTETLEEILDRFQIKDETSRTKFMTSCKTLKGNRSNCVEYVQEDCQKLLLRSPSSMPLKRRDYLEESWQKNGWDNLKKLSISSLRGVGNMEKIDGLFLTSILNSPRS
jgi:hypothetical protein